MVLMDTSYSYWKTTAHVYSTAPYFHGSFVLENFGILDSTLLVSESQAGVTFKTSKVLYKTGSQEDVTFSSDQIYKVYGFVV